MLNYAILNNPLGDWILALACAAAVYAAAHLAKAVLLKPLRRADQDRHSTWHDIVFKVLAQIHPAFLLIAAVYAGTGFLALPAASRVIAKLFLIVLLLQVGRLASQAIRAWFDYYRSQQLEKNAEAVTMLSSISFLLRMLLWTFLLLVGLDNFGINITSLVAGLGVGGVAVALAVQNILGDIFASFSIVLDKPFVIGDFIIVGEHMGTVEYVGLKTTRLRSLSGEQLIFANDDLLRSRIRNYKRMFERRVVFGLGVLYQTPPDKLERIPGLLRAIVEAQRPVRFDRAHFKEFGAFSLNFEIVYWVLDPDFNVYMDVQQAVNLAIFKRFAQEGIAFAYPTQTLYLHPPAAPQPAPA
jgi:small-conductance mechanosensitive channel